MQRNGKWLSLMVIGLMVLTSVCMAVTALAASDAEELVWPLPPDKPRVKFVKILQSEDDYTSGFFKWLRTVIFGPGSAENRLDRPFSVAVNSEGRIYVTDNGRAPCVMVFDESGAKPRVWRFGDSGRLVLVSPIDIAVNEADKLVYVSDSGLKRVAAFSFDGEFKFLLDPDVEFGNPTGLAYDPSGDLLYVVDTKEHDVKVFTGSGEYLRTIGARGTANGSFNFPSMAAVDSKGNLYVADSMNFRIQVFDRQGNFLRTFGSVGDGPGHFSRLKGIALDSDNNVYAVDAAFNNYQLFNSSGQLLMWVGHGGRDKGEFMLPSGIWIDEQDRIYVADRFNSRLQIFQYISYPDED